jgi:hypothetical protein
VTLRVHRPSHPDQDETVEAFVSRATFRDGAVHVVDMARSHASIERTPPEREDGAVDEPYADPDALRVLLESDGAREVSLESLGADGKRLDVLGRLPLKPARCEPGDGGAGVACFATAPVRFAMDDVDRAHPLVRGRSIHAEVGGAVAVWIGAKKAQQIRVQGPRRSPAGPIGALRASLRPFILRVTPGGAPAIGGTDPSATASARAEIASAGAIWSQCGVTFGDTATLPVSIVDPPPPYLVAVGGGLGLVASGGTVDLVVDGKPVTATVLAGWLPDRVADEVARAIERAGFVVTVSPNARIGPAVAGSVDLLVRRQGGALATVEGPAGGAPITADATLTVRIGSVELSDGVSHFTDVDAMAGTLEERTLLKAVDDGDPSTIEVVVIPMFSGGGRIGESFIGSDLSSLRNVVLLDRAGIRARRSSLTLAHELGHVLMDIPGHPDDYGVDTPTMLMDSDASDASPFGPRRLSLEDCARVVRQSGPGGRVPLLTPVPLRPLAVAYPRPPLDEPRLTTTTSR